MRIVAFDIKTGSPDYMRDPVLCISVGVRELFMGNGDELKHDIVLYGGR